MSGREDSAKVRAGRRRIEISHPDRALFPRAGISKLDLARAYVRLAKLIAPHVRGRALHLRRYPDGIEDEGFVSKSVPAHYPEWIERATLPKREGGEIEQIVGADAPTLAYLAGQNAISVHGWLSRADRPERPDRLIIDLDPTGDDFGEVREAAAIAREVFDEAGLPAFLKLTGSRGVHLVAPLDRSSDFEVARKLARRIADTCARRDPDLLTTETRKKKRRGRLFVDWLRNGYAQTAVVPYSVRARPGAPIAAPIAWEQLGSVGPRQFRLAEDGLERLLEREDPWRGIGRRAHSAERALRRLG